MFGRISAPMPSSSSFKEGRRNHQANSSSSSSSSGSGDNMRGLIPRCLDFIFTSLSVKQRKKSIDGRGASKASSLDGLGDFHCSCQFLEVYQEQVHDLLDPSCPVLKVCLYIYRHLYMLLLLFVCLFF
jgi:hypothetical protein